EAGPEENDGQHHIGQQRAEGGPVQYPAQWRRCLVVCPPHRAPKLPGRFLHYCAAGVEEDAYREMYALEDIHWWFRGRRDVIGALIERISLPASPRILAAGCGTGRNLVEFGPLGRASGVDPSADAVAFCRERGLGDVRQS